MPNIEIKAKCGDLQKIRAIAQKYQTRYVGELHQVDTYFFTREGRLKLREVKGETAQLIPYVKGYQMGPMKTEYALVPVVQAAVFKDLMSRLLGVELVVDKRREVFLIDNVRVHLDVVSGLGQFVELEAVYEEEGGPEGRDKQEAKVKHLMTLFDIKQEDLLDKSYVDYLLNKTPL